VLGVLYQPWLVEILLYLVKAIYLALTWVCLVGVIYAFVEMLIFWLMAGRPAISYRRKNAIYGLVLGVLGIAGVIISFSWWMAFYGSVVRELGVPGITTLQSAVPCLYSYGGVCEVARAMAGKAGHTPYAPFLFLASTLAFNLGAALFLSAEARRDSGEPQAMTV
jgi:hypothetical protein